MRHLDFLNRWRVKIHGEIGDGGNGCFMIPSPIDKQPLRVIASNGCGWDHVSVSRKNRCPNWPEMEHVRRLFFRADECAMQLHVPLTDYVDGSRYGFEHCLHIWRPQRAEIPRPPQFMVGGMTMEEATKQMEEHERDAAT